MSRGPGVSDDGRVRDRERGSRGRGTLRRREARAARTLISPTVVIVLTLVVLPILWTVVLSFQHVRLIQLRTAGLLGDYTLSNFSQVLMSPGFWSSLRTTLIYSVCGTAASIGLGLVAALALRRSFKGRTLIRASLLLPYVAPVVAATFVWGVMLNPQFGIVNEVGTNLLGWDEPISFLSQRPWALLTVIFFEMWRSFPFAFLFLMARLEAAPASLEE